MAKARALVLIDIQNEYFSGGGLELHGPEEAAGAARLALDAARRLNGRAPREAGVKVVHVRHESLDPKAIRFRAGSLGVEIHALAAPDPGEAVVTKRAVDSFAGTELEAILRSAGIEEGEDCEIAVAGMMTHMCVDAFLRAASARRWPCALLTDATATRDLEWAGRRVDAEDVKAALYAAFAFFGTRMTSVADWAREIGG